MQVRALQNIWHNGVAHVVGDVFEISGALAEQLRQAGLVDIIDAPAQSNSAAREDPPVKRAAVSRGKKK